MGGIPPGSGEEAVLDHVNFFRETFENHSAVMLVVDSGSGAIVDANHAAERFYGYPRAQLRAMNLQEINQRPGDEILASLQRAAERLQNTFLSPHKLANGDVRTVQVRTSPVTVAGRRCLFSIVDDISEDLASRFALQCLESAVWQSGDSVVITDAEGAILYVNPAFEHSTGYTRAEATGQNPRILKSGKQEPAFYANLWRTISSGSAWTGTLINRRKDGSLFPERATISPVKDGDGHITNYVAVKTDLSRQWDLEEQLRHSQKMEAVGRLASSVAHDFNNLLTVINGYSKLLLKRQSHDESTRKCLEEISHAGARATSLTQQLLTFSRRQSPEHRALDVNTLIVETQSMLQRLIGEDVWFSASLEPALGTIFADPGQVVQVLMNLAINARDAMPVGGSLQMKTENVQLEGECALSNHVQPGPFVRVSVSDTGIGMDAETQSHIFEPFFTTKPEGVGTGLGLSTVHEIVTRNGGCICVDSTPGAGTTFQICFPRAAGTPAAPAPEPQTVAAVSGRETVLLVEDLESLRRLACEMLEGQGYRVIESPSGEETLRIADTVAGPIHLLLTDIAMPGMDGRTLAAKMRERRPGINVLYMSGSTGIDREAISREQAAFVQKPFSQEELAGKVRQAMALSASAGK